MVVKNRQPKIICACKPLPPLDIPLRADGSCPTCGGEIINSTPKSIIKEISASGDEKSSAT